MVIVGRAGTVVTAIDQEEGEEVIIKASHATTGEEVGTEAGEEEEEKAGATEGGKTTAHQRETIAQETKSRPF